MNPRDKFAASKTFDEAIEAVRERFDYADYIRLTEEGGATCGRDSARLLAISVSPPRQFQNGIEIAGWSANLHNQDRMMPTSTLVMSQADARSLATSILAVLDRNEGNG